MNLPYTYIKKADAEGLYSRTDKIVESMSEAEIEADTEAETDAYVEPKYTHTPETEVEINTSVVPIPEAEAELLLEPESINRPILATDGESVHEKNGRSCKKWSLSCLIIGIAIGGTATGLLLHFTNPFLNCEGDFIVDPEIETSVATSTVLETVVPTARNALFVIYRK